MAVDNHIVVKVEARKLTTRDGSHEDDSLYLSQIKAQVVDFLQMLEFKKSSVDVSFSFEESSDKCTICSKELVQDKTSSSFYCQLHGTRGVPKSTLKLI